MQTTQLTIFTMLFVLSIFRPQGLFDEVGLPVGPLSICAAVILFLRYVHSSEQFKAFWERFKIPLSLLVAYNVISLISLVYNYSRYDDITVFFRWGLVFIIGQSFLPLCIFTFLLSQNVAKPPSSSMVTVYILASSAFLLIPSSVLIQIYFPEIAPQVFRFFVSADITQFQQPYPVRGVLATSTDLGAICAILWLTATAYAVKSSHDSRIKASVFLLYSVTFALTGVLSESRNFILFSGVASLTLLFANLWVRNKVALAACVSLLATAFYLSAYFIPGDLLSKLGRNIPHFDNVAKGAETSILDLIPRVSFDSLGLRGPLWESALRLIAENPFLGISNGGFRLADDCACNKGNAHNILLQSAIDGGVLGTLLMILIFTYVVKSAHNKWSLALIFGVSATLMVDNFTDHSYAWIVVVSFASVALSRQNPTKAN